MKSYHITALILAISLWGCGPKDHDEHAAHSHEAHEHSDGHEHGSHDHDGHSHAAKETHSHDGEIDLHDEVAERFGVKFDTIRPAGFHEVVRVSGRAEPSAASQGIVSAPVSGTVHFARGINAGSSVKAGSVIAVIDPASTLGGDANAAAKANLDAAKRELDRIKPLYKDRLVTASEYNNALAAYEQAKAAYSPRANGGRALSPIAGSVTSLNVAEGQYVAVGEPVATVSSAKELTLRVELPRRYLPLASSFKEAVIEQPYTDPVRIAITGTPAPVAQQGTASAFVPMYFTVAATGSITPGATFTAHLIGSGRDGVITLPLSGISEQQGNYFVYERVHPESYVKRRVQLGTSDGQRVEIKGGITPGAVVVSEGATAVRLAETGANIPEGHTHNH